MTSDRTPDADVGTASFNRRDRRGRFYGVTLKYEIVDGQLRVVSVAVSSRGGVDASMMRDVPLATLADEGRASQAKLWAMHLDRTEISDRTRRKVHRVLAASRAPGDDPELLELIATTYRRAHLAGDRPTKAVHEELVRRGHQVSR
ncbi:MAG: hypothetical protein ACRDZ3_19995, partial [Acidimicrobiia bacterium]